MIDPVYFIAGVVVLFIIMFYVGWKFNSVVGKNNIVRAEEEAKRILEDAEKDAKNLKKEKLLEVKDEWFKKKQEFDVEINSKKQKLQNYEKKLESREDNIEKKYDLVINKERENKQIEKKIVEKESLIDQKKAELDKLILEQNIRLEKISTLTSEEAKKMLMENMINKAKSDASQQIQKIRDEAKIEGKKIAQKIVVQAIQRTAVDHSVETTVSVVQIQNDEMKGRIIGREGRNIRAFEAATGVDVIGWTTTGCRRWGISS